jgi:general transcription factor 3C polypeptide 3 (transcription factor C subunit 4)
VHDPPSPCFHRPARTCTCTCAHLQAYARRRGLPQEVAYNAGRAAHQLGLTALACQYYEAALAAPPARGLERQRGDLSREAAHNLVLLYSASGASTLAREVMMRHLVVV